MKLKIFSDKLATEECKVEEEQIRFCSVSVCVHGCICVSSYHNEAQFINKHLSLTLHMQQIFYL